MIFRDRSRVDPRSGGGTDRCRATQRQSRRSCSSSTTCSRSTATTICRALPMRPPTRSRRSSSEAGKLASEVLTPLNRTGDIEGCTRHDDGRVTTPKGFREAYASSVDGGWIGMSAPTEYGGQGLPSTLTVAINEFLASANLAFSMYPALVQGAIAAILTPRHRRAEENLSAENDRRPLGRHDESHRAALRHGSGLAAHQGGEAGRRLATRSPARRFSFPAASRISPRTSSISCSRASKARRKAPRASRSSSCRKCWSMPTARSARKNGVSCGSIEHKMGIHGNSTCVMNYDNATGYPDRRRRTAAWPRCS